MKIVYGSFINLAHRTDKCLHIHGQIKRLPIPFIRTEGVIVSNLDLYKPDDYIEYGSLRHKGTVGCFLAHKNAVKSLLDISMDKGLNPNDYVLVVEDDIVVDRGFFNYVTAELPDYEFADVLFFDAAHVNDKHVLARGEALDASYLIDKMHGLYYVYGDWPLFAGAFCYAIRIRTLPAIHERLDQVEIYKDVDGFYYRNFKCYTCITNMIRVDESFYSDRHLDADWNRDKIGG